MTNRQHSSMLLPVLMLGVGAFFYLYEFLLRVSPNVLEKELVLDFAMDPKQFGLLSSCYYWAYAPLQLPVGALTDKYGPRRLLTFAILVCGASTILLSYTKSYFFGCFTRFFIGAGSALAFISCIKIIHLWFKPKHFALLTGLTLAIGTLGAAAGGTPLSIALNYLDWRGLMNIIGWVGIVLGVIAWFTIRDQNPNLPEENLPENQTNFWECVKEISKYPQNWLVGIYAFLVTAPTDAFGGTWGVKFLTDVHGISRDSASFAAVTMTFIGMAVGSPLLGWFSGYFNQRKIPMAVSAIIASIAITVIIFVPKLTGGWAAILFFIFGAAGTYVLAFVMIRRLSDAKYVATAVGFVNMLSIFGSAILTFLIGWVLDLVRSHQVEISGQPIITAYDFQLSLVGLAVFYAVSAFIVVPLIREPKTVS